MSCRVTQESYIWNAGRYRTTGASHSSFPSSTRIPRAVAVNTLVLDAMPKRVSASTRSGALNARTPYPLARTTLSSFTMATDSPGTGQAFWAAAT